MNPSHHASIDLRPIPASVSILSISGSISPPLRGTQRGQTESVTYVQNCGLFLIPVSPGKDV